jgi:hypothetical protein
MDITMLEMFYATCFLFLIILMSFGIFAMLMGIVAFIQLGVNFWEIRKRAKTCTEDEFSYFWIATGQILWKKLHK